MAERTAWRPSSQRTGEIQRAAISEPVIITNHGRPRMIMLTVEEFGRFKRESGEAVPVEVRRERKAAIRAGLLIDPLGYDTRDLRSCAISMAEAAISGKNRPFVDAEISAVERRLRGDR
jgi:hypothetical protein